MGTWTWLLGLRGGAGLLKSLLPHLGPWMKGTLVSGPWGPWEGAGADQHPGTLRGCQPGKSEPNRERRPDKGRRSRPIQRGRPDKAGPLSPGQEAAVLEVLPAPAGLRLSSSLQGCQVGLVQGSQVCLWLRPHPLRRPRLSQEEAGPAGWQMVGWEGGCPGRRLPFRTDCGPGRGPEPAPPAPGPWWDFSHLPGAKLG